MRATVATGLLAIMLGGCGGGDEPEEPMKVEDTVFAPVVTAPARVQDRTNAAVELHRANLYERLEQDEGDGDEEVPAGD